MSSLSWSSFATNVPLVEVEVADEGVVGFEEEGLGGDSGVSGESPPKPNVPFRFGLKPSLLGALPKVKDGGLEPFVVVGVVAFFVGSG